MENNNIQTKVNRIGKAGRIVSIILIVLLSIGAFSLLLAGGVCANRWIRNHIVEKLAKRGIRVWMPDNRYSGDNASGCAAYARRQGEGQR